MLRVEIWTDDEDAPGLKMGLMGEVDISSLRSLSEGGGVEDFAIEFKNPIVGLEPNSAHYVVLDYIDSRAFIMREDPYDKDSAIEKLESVLWFWSNDIGENATIVGAVFTTTEDPLVLDGTYTPPAKEDYIWQRPPVVGIMKVTEDPKDLPRVRIASIQHSNEAISLKWNSLPYKKYIVEYSEDLVGEIWDELEDGIESGGAETEFVDCDPVRLSAKRGYYRVRREN